jgi:hypothetical protein
LGQCAVAKMATHIALVHAIRLSRGIETSHGRLAWVVQIATWDLASISVNYMRCDTQMGRWIRRASSSQRAGAAL